MRAQRPSFQTPVAFLPERTPWWKFHLFSILKFETVVSNLHFEKAETSASRILAKDSYWLINK
jgi:hypothetical protein